MWSPYMDMWSPYMDMWSPYMDMWSPYMDMWSPYMDMWSPYMDMWSLYMDMGRFMEDMRLHPDHFLKNSSKAAVGLCTWLHAVYNHQLMSTNLNLQTTYQYL